MILNPSFASLFDRAWNSLSPRLALGVGLTLVYIIAQSVLGMIPVVGTLVGIALSPGYILCLNAIRKNEDFGFDDFFWGLKDFQRVIQFLVLSLVKILLIVIGLILLIIPGLYFIIALSFSETYFTFEKQDAIASIKASMKLLEGRWWYMHNLFFVICLFNLMGLLLLGVGLLVTLPISALVILEFYNYLQEEQKQARREEITTPGL